MPSEIIALVMLLALVGGSFWLGWDIAVHRQRAATKRLQRQYTDLISNTEQVLITLGNDPTATAIDAGRRYATTRMRDTLTEIEQEPLP